MQKQSFSFALAGLIFIVQIVGAQLAAAEESDSNGSTPILTGPIAMVPGPKRTVAVGAFDTMGPQSAGSTGWNVGGSVAAMLTTALQESGHFIVLERAGLSAALNEQQMAAHHLSGGTGAPQPGSIIPAQYLIEGAVTEFGSSDNGGGLSIGGASGAFSSGLSLSGTKGSVAFDLRIVDTRTTAIVASFKVQRKLSSTSVGFTGGYSGIALGGNKFWSTPLGAATRSALNEAVGRIAETIASGSWEGAVVEVDGATLYVNAGASAGLKSGDVLSIQHPSKVFTDPTTGAVLSQHEEILGTVRINQVEDKLSSGTYASKGSTVPVRGDLVVFENSGR